MASRRLALALCAAVALGSAFINAQIPGRNVNMVSGQTWPDGDPFLQRQNEPSMAASTRNPLHLLAGANDYRTIDLPGLPDGEETGDAWVGVFKSVDGGQRWKSNLIPGYPQDTSPEGLASPLKAFHAAADPVVRAGTSGLLYYAGLAFNRGANGRSGVFVTRYIDNNNREKGDPVIYLGTRLVASDTGLTGRFLDKPWIAVDVPRLGATTCRITTPAARPGAPAIVQNIAGGMVYAAFSAFTGDGPTLKSDIMFTYSANCGQTWSTPVRLNPADNSLNQGATIAIDPLSGTVSVAWRRFTRAGSNQTDAIMVAHSLTLGRRFLAAVAVRRLSRVPNLAHIIERILEHRRTSQIEVAELEEFDQSTSQASISFRTNAYPTMVWDDRGRLYIAWAERGFSTIRPDGVDGDSRIVMSNALGGLLWSPPIVVSENNTPGHQIMPSLAYAGAKLMVIYYDLRDDVTELSTKYIDDKTAQVTRKRHTVDIRASMASPGQQPVFEPSVRVSDYLFGTRLGQTGPAQQLQHNPPNLPMFRQGTVPFLGDYIDLAPAPAFLPIARGIWIYNTLPGKALPVFHATWTDNRDVRQPGRNAQGLIDWTRYTPPTYLPGISPYDPTRAVPACQPDSTGSRNQNIYTARITGGLLAGSPSNSKPLSTNLQRGFVIFAHNTTTLTKVFRMRVANQPVGGRASFAQFPLPPYTAASPAPLTFLDVITPPRSMASRTLYVTSSDPHAQLTVDVQELSAAGDAQPLPNGLQSSVTLNADIENPPIDADIENADIENKEVNDADIENATFQSANPQNADIENADIENADIENIVVANADIENADIENPSTGNADIENADIENADIENQSLTDVTWTAENTGNTTTAFNVNLFLSQTTVPAGVKTQLILHKIYTTPNAIACDLKFETRNVLISNIVHPTFVDPSSPSLPNPNRPDADNGTMWLAPGESGRITLRIADPDPSNNVIIINAKGEPVSIDPAFVPGEKITAAVVPQPVSTEQARAGVTKPPVITPDESTAFFVQQPTNTRPGEVMTPAVRVQVRDRSGAVLPGASVTLTLDGGTGAVLTGGGPAVTDATGVAQFASLRVSQAGSGFRLTAAVTAPGQTFAPAHSAPFDVVANAGLVVVNTNDNGPGSLRQAIADANANVGVADVISFAIPNDGPPLHTIVLASPLPALSDPVVIDGTTQPGFDTETGRPAVQVSGAQLPLGSTGLLVTSTGVVVRGLSLTGFGSTGPESGGQAVWLQAGAASIEGNWIGLAPGGTVVPNHTGVLVDGGTHTVGGAAAATRNVISGNREGILLRGGTGTQIRGNYIGTNPSGTAAAGNVFGILAFNVVSQTTIGGAVPEGGYFSATWPGNVISGNTAEGIALQRSEVGAPTNTQISGNVIGLSTAGADLGNGGNGVHIVDSAQNTIGGTLSTLRNVISGNTGEGVRIDGALATDNTVRANFIGTSISGLDDVGNGASGIFIRRAPGNRVIGNTIAGNDGFAGVAICGNLEFCGGFDAGTQGNQAVANVLTGNVIGLNAAGAALGNSQGITVDGAADTTIGGSVAADRNVISSNGVGVVIFSPGANGNFIRGNYIGTDPGGTADRGNSGPGISIQGGLNTIVGGDDESALAANLIAFNTGAGIQVTGGAGHTLRVNQIGSNGGLGIDLGGDGVTPNDGGDGDAGANGLQNFPVITSLSSVSGSTTIAGTLNSAAQKVFRIDFYSSPACDASGFGEGRNRLGATTTSTNSDGNASFEASFSAALAAGEAVTAVATDDSGNTSEFSECVTVSQAVGSLTDPSGDALPNGNFISPDLVGVTVFSTGTTLQFKVRFATETFNPATTRAQLLLDTDRNAATGHPGVNAGCETDSQVIGSEYLANAQTSTGEIMRYNGTCNSFSFAAGATVVAVGDGYDITVPLAAIEDDGVLNYKVVVSSQLASGGYTGVLDVMSNVGLAPGTTGGS